MSGHKKPADVVKLNAVRDRIDTASSIERSDADGDRGGKPKDSGLPEGCPVIPLGTDAGAYYVLDTASQVRSTKGREHSKLQILDLFARAPELPAKYWPRTDKRGRVTTFEGEEAAAALMRACSLAGVWTPAEKLRGSGAWLGRNGELMLHCGDGIGEFSLKGGERWHAPGVIDGYVYPASTPTARPAPASRIKGGASPAAELLEALETWGWARPSLDPHLLLGFIGACILGGGLPWRPIVWLTGGRGKGKSTALELIQRVLDGDVLAANDVTAAGIWQKQRHSTRAVLIDELEPEADNRRTDGIIRLVRSAASGGQMLRGGADHEATEFVARGCFLIASILTPPLRPQDRSRLVLLEMAAAPTGSGSLDLSGGKWEAVGAQMRRRLVDGWKRFDAALQAYRGALIEGGHDRRRADVYGALLACADLLLFDREVNSETVGEWVRLIEPEALEELGDDEEEEDACLRYLLTSSVRVYSGGSQSTVAELVGTANNGDVGELVATANSPLPKNVEARNANGQLGKFGMRIVDDEEGRWFVIANKHATLGEIFKNTRWASGGGTSGGWSQVLRRLPGARAGGTKSFASLKQRCTLLPVSVVVNGDDDAND